MLSRWKAIFDEKEKYFGNFQMIFQGNFKIQGARVTYDIYSMMLLLRDTTFRAEREGKVMFFYISELHVIFFYRNEAKLKLR